MAKRLDELNPAQRACVQTLGGPLLVLAGAGTGKTRTVTYRIAELIRQGVSADRILAVTFTRKAAAEMKSRTGKLLGRRRASDAPTPFVSTYHALCLDILRRHIERLGYPARFAIYDRGDQESVARQAIAELKMPGAKLRPTDLLGFISRWKTHAVAPPRAAADSRSDIEHLAAAAYRRYQQALKSAGAVDFDDLLLLVDELFRRFSAVRRQEAARYDHLLIDEYQDTNDTQYRIVKRLASGHRNLCVVGDDDQSIYAWRGAQVSHILQFKRDWPEAKIVRLVDNYRSTPQIIELANRLIAHNKTRHDKTLRAALPPGESPRVFQLPDERQEAAFVVGDIVRRINDGGRQANDLAILFRTKQQPRPFEEELRRAGVPYVLIGGRSFYDRKEVRDIFAYLKLIAAPEDEVALRRVINTPPRGVSRATVERLAQFAASESITLWQAASRADRAGLNDQSRVSIEELVQLIQLSRDELADGRLVAGLSNLIDRIDYLGAIDRSFPDPQERQARRQTVEEVVNAAGAYERESRRPTVEEFLDASLAAQAQLENDKEDQLRRGGVRLMTLHSAKGLEFPEVYLVGMEEGLLPHKHSIGERDDDVEEERRLCYVGVTRAQRRLVMTLSLSRLKWGKPRDSAPSRFLFEATGIAPQPRADAHQRPNPSSVARRSKRVRRR